MGRPVLVAGQGLPMAASVASSSDASHEMVPRDVEPGPRGSVKPDTEGGVETRPVYPSDAHVAMHRVLVEESERSEGRAE